MELYDMKYFLEIARFESIARASQTLHISSASLSRAIGRIEAELGMALFFKDGRNIKLSPSGKELQKKVSTIVKLEEDIRLQMAPTKNALNLEIMAEEALHQFHSFRIEEVLKKRFPDTVVTMIVTSNIRVIQSVRQGDVSLGIIAGQPSKEFLAKKLSREKFFIYAGSDHPLVKKKKASLSLKRVLEEDFAICGHSILGVANDQNTDGWNEQKYPRKVKYIICSLLGLKQCLDEGKAISYLPEYLGKQMNLKKLSIEKFKGLEQDLYLITKKNVELSWINYLMDSF